MLAIRIETERGESYERPALSTLAGLVERIGADGDHFVIVERIVEDPDLYIQVWRDTEADGDGAGDGGGDGSEYQLEHRDGSAERHFQAYVPTAAEVVEVMVRWARQDKDWDAGPAWERLRLS